MFTGRRGGLAAEKEPRMRRDGRWMPRLTLNAALAVATSVSPSVVTAVGPDSPPKVEFVEIQGQRCLQPVVRAARVELADYRAAELRWLAIRRPTVSAPEWKTEIVLAPQEPADGEQHSSTVQRETAYLDGVVGPSATVCFDIALKEREAHHGHHPDVSACPEDDVLETLHDAVFFLEHRRDEARVALDIEQIRRQVTSESPGAAMVLPLIQRIAALTARDGVLEPDSEQIRSELHASPCMTAEAHERFHRALPPLR